MSSIERVIPFLSGLLFSVGLVLAGMTQPAKVVGFLDFFGNWDPSLMLVMVGAIAVYMPIFRIVRRRHRTVFGAHLYLPSRQDLDPRLIGGAALFGVGWGLAGYCPGPGVASLVTGSLAPLTFVATMIGGMSLYALADAALRARADGAVRQVSTEAGP